MFDGLYIFIFITAILALALMIAKIGAVRHAWVVTEGHAALLYRKGKFVEVLGAGRHVG